MSILKIIKLPFTLLKWLILVALVAAVLVILWSLPAEGFWSHFAGINNVALAAEEDINTKKEDKRLDSIAQNCPTIKSSLTQLQKVDSKTRTYLGTTYESVLNKFIIPLNLRLVKNNRATLSDIQEDFTNEQTTFRNNYTTYMKELEILVAMDCRAQPQEFSVQLDATRQKRSELHNSTKKMSDLIKRQYDAVVYLRDELKPKDKE